MLPSLQLGIFTINQFLNNLKFINHERVKQKI